MRQKVLILLTGMLLGAALFGGGAAHAAGVLAERSRHKVTLDGQPVSVVAYVINGSNYFQLRDLAKLLDVDIQWNGITRTVDISTEGGYTEEAPAQQAPQSASSAAGTDLYDVRLEIADFTNSLRRQNGLPALTVDEDLMATAQVRAEEAAATLAYRHERPDGSKIATVVSSTGTLLMGENMGMKDYRSVDTPMELARMQVGSWENSEGHRRNMLQTIYHSMGVGIAQDRYGMYYIVQTFAGGTYAITGVDAPIIP